MYILDTDFLVEILRNNKQALSKLKEILGTHNEIHTSSINLHELIKGAHLSANSTKNLESISKLTQTLNILALDGESVFLSGKIEAEQEKKGRLIGQNDIFIASIALKNNLTLITRNKKHFEGVDNLKIEGW